MAEITIAGNLRDMLSGIATVGDDIDARGRYAGRIHSVAGNDHRGPVALGGCEVRGQQKAAVARGLRPQTIDVGRLTIPQMIGASSGHRCAEVLVTSIQSAP